MFPALINTRNSYVVDVAAAVGVSYLVPTSKKLISFHCGENFVKDKSIFRFVVHNHATSTEKSLLRLDARSAPSTTGNCDAPIVFWDVDITLCRT